MKTAIVPLILFALLPQFVSGQTTVSERYYVVIGAFAKIDNATRFTNKANSNQFIAQFAFNSERKLHYVYLLETNDRRKAYALAIKMRVESEYRDCWVYTGTLGTNTVKNKTEEKKAEPVVTAPPKGEKKDSLVVLPPARKDSLVAVKPVEVKPEVKKPAGKPFLFKLTNATSGNPLTGEVHLLESARATQYLPLRGNEINYLKSPSNRDGVYTVITQVPGYQQTTLTFSYNDANLAKGETGELVIPIELKPAKAGNYIDFNHVRFFRNSAILGQDSQNELDGLAALMKENKKYEIKIHGHCNGKQNRNITVMGTSKKFFGMDPGANKKITSASDKILSEERAKVVRAYLVSQGIEESRIGIKAEGGRIPLYEPGSTLTDLNDRIEVEIRQN